MPNYFALMNKTGQMLTGVMLVFPLFFTASLQIYRGTSFDHEFSIPLSVAYIALLATVLIRRLPAIFRKPGPILVQFCFVFITAVALVVNGPGELHLLAIYLVPMGLGLFSGYVYKSNQVGRLVLPKSVAYTVLVSAILHIVASINEFGVLGAFSNRGADSIFGLYSVYQKFTYYPTILAFGVAFCLYSFRDSIRLMAIWVILIDIAITGSREAVILVSFFMIYFYLSNASCRRRLLLNLITVASCLIVLVILLFALPVGFHEDLVFLVKMRDLFESGGYTAGRAEAIEYIYSFFEITPQFILLGSSFQFGLPEIGTPHNQYLEWHLRGGVPFLLLNIAIIAGALVRLRQCDDTESRLFFVTILASVLICNNINTPYRAPYTAVFLWFIIGMALSPNKFKALLQCKHETSIPAA